MPTKEAQLEILKTLFESFDREHGGFKGDVKFPLSFQTSSFIHLSEIFEDQRPQYFAETTLEVHLQYERLWRLNDRRLELHGASRNFGPCRHVLPFGFDHCRTFATEVVEPVVAVPPPTTEPHLTDPREHLGRRCRDRHATSGDGAGITAEIVTDHRAADLVGRRTPVPEQHRR